MMAFFNFAKADLPYLQLVSTFDPGGTSCNAIIDVTGNLLSRQGCPSSSYCVEYENSSMYFELGWISDVAPYIWNTYSTSPTFTNITGEVEYEFDVPYDVSLVVKNSAGKDSLYQANYITVNKGPQVFANQQ